MAKIEELFPNPTVKNVIFQIRYPNLFYLEDRIGDFQIEIMELFPESSLIVRKPLLLADVGTEMKIEDLSEKVGSEVTKKIWRFSSAKNYVLNILNDSLDISSEYHKTYDNKKSEERFRDIIKKVLEKFIAIMKIPLISRIGLRYIDVCPLPTKDSKTYATYYNSAINIGKFSLEEATEMVFSTSVARGDYFLRYREALEKKGENYNVILDFDAFARSIKAGDYLTVTDQLHDIIIQAFTDTIKEPVYEYMRKKK
jgi:uncharacterized protein (TIGR04255 family)